MESWRGIFLLALVFLPVATAWARLPDWASRDTQRREGNILRLVCAGSGPSIGFARRDALDSCRVSAAQQVANDLSVKSLSISSERDVAYQQEVLNQTHVTGLTCLPRREQIVQKDAEITLWLLCEFDLSKARAERGREPQSDRESDADDFAAGSYVVDDERKVLTITSVPGCSDMIVRGSGPARVVPCDHNPVSIVLRPGDGEIILRAPNHFPKSIFLGPKREVRGYVQIILEPSS